MNTPLNNDTQQKARDLARKITVAHDLDPEIQEELYGHIEDKLLAYTSGEERVSDEDAFILVREHFGDARAIRGLLRGVHREAVHVGLARNILALFIAGGCIGCAGKFAQSAFSLGVFLTGIPLTFMAHRVIEMLFVFATLSTLLFVLSRWKHAVASGGRPWYVRWSLPRMSLWAVLLFLLTWALPNVRVNPEGGVGAPIPSFMGILLFVALLGILIGTCVIWLWWVGTTQHRARHTFNLGWLWLGFWMLVSLLPALTFHIGSGNLVAYGVTTLTEGQIGDTSVAGYLTWGGPWRSVFEFGLLSLFYGTIAVVSCLAIITWRVIGHRRNAGVGHTGTSA